MSQTRFSKLALAFTFISAFSLMCCKATNNQNATAPQVVKSTVNQEDDNGTPADVTLEGTEAVIPNAVVYKTNGDYNNHVFITLNDARTEVVSFPDRADIDHYPTPFKVAQGWLLDQRGGISKNAAFLDWTYEQYAQLPATPSVDILLEHIIPEAKVTQVIPLTITLSDALEILPNLQKYENLRQYLSSAGIRPQVTLQLDEDAEEAKTSDN